MGFRSKTAGVGKGIVLALAALVAACAGHRHDSGDVIVDTQGVDMHAYHHDLEECRVGRRGSSHRRWRAVRRGPGRRRGRHRR
jgi:hypothetical protein